MANTKDTLIIVPGLGKMDECKNAAGRVLGADATYGLDMATPADATTFATAQGYTLEAYAAATAGISTVDTTGVDVKEEIFVTLIDVTAGRRQFPRKTFRAATAAALAVLIDDAELEVGDGKAYQCAESGGTLTITYPADVICKIAANEDSVVAEGTPPVLTVGLTNAKAVELVGNKITKVGRTNRVGFPVIEPSVFQDLGLSATANYDMLTKQIIGDVKFDKNVGASYQDVENVTILMLDGASLTAS